MSIKYGSLHRTQSMHRLPSICLGHNFHHPSLLWHKLQKSVSGDLEEAYSNLQSEAIDDPVLPLEEIDKFGGGRIGLAVNSTTNQVPTSATKM